MDWRNIKNGFEIPAGRYCDQPYLVKTDDGAWICSLTTGEGDEGQEGQHVKILRSPDMGKTWRHVCRMEKNGAPENSYSVLLKTEFGRIYCFYNYNADNIREVKANDPPYEGGICRRVDSLGSYVFRYSDDNGFTWSDKRKEVPVRKFKIDLENPYGGSILFFWNVGKPFVHENKAYLSIHKVGELGEGFFVKSEGVLVKSDNIMTERDVDKLNFETLPAGDEGIRGPKGGGLVSEEHSYAVLEDGTFFTVFRTIDGRPAYSYSRDGGYSWEPSKYMPVKHPRAANFIWKTGKRRYLYWFHNHGGKWYEGRNPAWCLAAFEKQGRNGNELEWSQPEVLLYDENPSARISYPDLIYDKGVFHVSETQKQTARIHRIDPGFMEKLYDRDGQKQIVQDGLIYDSAENPEDFPFPRLMSDGASTGNSGGDKGFKKGFTIEFMINGFLDCPKTLIDSTRQSGEGISIEYKKEGSLGFSMSDGRTKSCWDSDKGRLNGESDHVAVIVDGGPSIISFVINGVFNDGGDERQFGWGRFNANITDIEGGKDIRIDESISVLRVYDRALMTVEICKNQAAGK